MDPMPHIMHDNATDNGPGYAAYGIKSQSPLGSINSPIKHRIVTALNPNMNGHTQQITTTLLPLSSPFAPRNELMYQLHKITKMKTTIN